ncbi:MAG: hypothetical protein HZC54_16780 [Verrucomicrobia bacterium]|nr:hypothetical protein [Verrucomicrobiota bacterium]
MKLSIQAIAVIAALSTLAAAIAQGADHDYSTKHALIYKQVTPQQFAALPDTASLAMMCAKCKTVMVMTKRELGTKPGRGSVMEPMTTHTCPGCGGKLALKPGGKETEWVHTCKDCGDHSVTCCALVEGGKPAAK